MRLLAAVAASSVALVVATACATTPLDADYIPGLIPPVPRPEARWGYLRAIPNDGAEVQFVRPSKGDAKQAVDETHEWYEDLMYDLGWNKSEESPPRWSYADRYHFGTTFWHEEVDGRKVGATIWVSGGARRVIVRISCCEEEDGYPEYRTSSL